MKKQIRINKKITSLFFVALMIVSVFVAFITPVVAEPPPAGEMTAWSSVSSGANQTLAIRIDGTLWAWGRNSEGQLGVGDNTDKNIPTQVGTDTNWSSVSSAWSHTLAIKKDGTLWAWGEGWSSQLGLGDIISRNIPTQVGTDTNWSSVSGGEGGHTVAIKADRTLWAWGDNGQGQLGVGDNTNRNIPTQVGVDTNWSSVSAGHNHTLARKTDGTLWAWGDNFRGQLGLGDNTNRNIPTQVGTDTNWSFVYNGINFTMAIKTDRTLWAWGWNNNSQLGLGGTVNKNIPTQVGTDTNWSSVSGGSGYTLAIRTDRTLWAWGYNLNNRLGIAGAWYTIDTPTQVGTDTNWSSVSIGSTHSMAIKTNSTLWAWGSGHQGRLGFGDTASIQIPTQLPTISIAPTSLAFSNITIGTASYLTFTVTNVGSGTLIGTASVPAGPFSITTGATYSIAPGINHIVTVRFAPTARGPVSATVTFTGDGNATRTVSGVGAIDPAIAVTPTELLFNNVIAGTASYLTFAITNTGDGTLTGTASVPAGPFSITAGADYNIISGTTHAVTVRFAPTIIGPVSDTVTFTGGGGATRTISGTGVVAPTVSMILLPAISITPAELAFGSVTVGDTRDLTFTVANSGTSTLIGAVSLPIGPFSITTGADYNIVPGTPAHTVTIRFAPTVTGSVSNIVIFTGGGGATRIISGTGVVPPPLPPLPPPPPPPPLPSLPPPTELPPVELPPTETIPTELPPIELPPTELPPTELPPTETPPVEERRAIPYWVWIVLAIIIMAIIAKATYRKIKRQKR